MAEKKVFPPPLDLQRKLRQMERLMEINLTLTSTLELDQVLERIIVNAVEMLECEAGSILLYNREEGCLSFVAATGSDPRKLAEIPVPMVGSLAGEIFRNNQPLITEQAASDPRHDTLVEKKVNFHTRSLLGVPMRIQERVMGVLEALNKKSGPFTQEDVDLLSAIASQAAVAIENAQLVHALQEAYDATLEGWATALDLRDKETEGHTRRVTERSVWLGGQMGLNEEALDHLRQGALLHDIGKMAIPDHILLKPDRLSPEEWLIMRQHPQHAYRMLAPIAYLRSALDIPYCHHEKYDGSGYPRGLKGKEIPLGARIFSIVDVWDALTSDRYYRKAWPEDETAAYIQEQAGKSFDPAIVRTFLDGFQAVTQKV